MENFLMIGGNGFIGSNILDILLKKNKSVRIFDRNFETYRKPFREVEYIKSNFDDTLALTEALTNIDCVIHSLSTSMPSTSNKYPIQDIENNLVNTVNLLDIMVSKGIKRILFLSSGGTVYGVPNIFPVLEDHPTNPICSYGIVKLSIEKYLLMYQKLYDLHPIILRISNPFGPRQSHMGLQGFIATMISNYLNNKTLTIYGNGDVIRDYIYIIDVAKACYQASISNKTGIFNVGSGIGYSINDVVEIFEEIVGCRININYIDSRNLDIPKIILNIDKMKHSFGWNPEVDLIDGMKIHLNWMKKIITKMDNQ